MSSIDLSALEADLEALPPKGTSTRKCRLQELIAEFPEAAETLQKAVSSTQYSAAAIAKVLTNNGLVIGESAVIKHRKGECTVCKVKA